MAPRKQHHTARTIWRRLVDEHGAEVAETTVRDYVCARKRRVGWPVGDVFVPQIHAPGAGAEVGSARLLTFLSFARELVEFGKLSDGFLVARGRVLTQLMERWVGHYEQHRAAPRATEVHELSVALRRRFRRRSGPVTSVAVQAVCTLVLEVVLVLNHASDGRMEERLRRVDAPGTRGVFGDPTRSHPMAPFGRLLLRERVVHVIDHRVGRVVIIEYLHQGVCRLAAVNYGRKRAEIPREKPQRHLQLSSKGDDIDPNSD